MIGYNCLVFFLFFLCIFVFLCKNQEKWSTKGSRPLWTESQCRSAGPWHRDTEVFPLLKKKIGGGLQLFNFLFVFLCIFMFLSVCVKIGKNGRPKTVDHFGQKVSIAVLRLYHYSKKWGFYFILFYCFCFLFLFFFLLFLFCQVFALMTREQVN